MTIEAMTKVCGGIYHGSDIYRQKEISSITTDSRKVQDNCMFVAIKGERSDGHDYISSCLDNGALCCISEKELEGEDRPYIQVQSSLQALKALAKYYREQLDIKVVGITGSVGKTSTKEAIASVLSQKYKVLKTLGNFNNGIGLPLTVFRLREDDEVAVLEMGISNFGEMNCLSEIAKPDVCIITNIGLCHLENLKSRDGILEEKSHIFDAMSENGTIILNGDDDKLADIKEVNGKKPVFFGFDSKNDIYADNIVSHGLAGMSAVIHGLSAGSFDDNNDTDDEAVGSESENAQSVNTEALEITIPVAGQHMVANAMAAAAAGRALGLTLEQIKNGIAAYETITGRNHIIRTDNFVILDDCYNANPVSMKASIDILSETDGRKVCILGDMFELGENEKQLHYEVGTYLAGKSIDVLITVGELAENIAKGAKAEFDKKTAETQNAVCEDNSACSCEIFSFATKQDLINELSTILRHKDNILVKASHGMEFPVIIEAICRG